MDVFYQSKALKALNAKIAFFNGAGSRKLAVDMATALELGNEHDRLRGLDRYGRPMKPVKTRKGRYKGAAGPPLAPFGVASRSINRFRAAIKGSRPPYTIIGGWQDVVSDKGFPFLPVHDKGSAKRGIPARPLFGISPNTWVLIRSRIAEFTANFSKLR